MKTQLEQDIRGWDSIVDHRTGTEGDNLTAEWLADEIRVAGVEPMIDTFPFTRRVLHECVVSVGSQRAEGVPLFDGGVTHSYGVTAPLTALTNENSDQPIHGIGLVSFSSTGRHTSMQRMNISRSQSYDAIVAYAAADDIAPGLALLNAPRYQDPFGCPVLQVSSEHGEWLEAATVHGESAHVVAHVTTEETTATNVQARIAGHDSSLAPLVIMTPRSAWWTCTAERAGGIAIWLACIRHLAAEPGDRDVIFTANTGHELGHVGLEHYLHQHTELVRGAHAWIHLGANYAAVDSQVVYQASPDLMQLGLDALASAETTPETVISAGTRPSGEAENIYDGGGRYLSLVGSNRWFHHPDDRWPHTIDMVRIAKIAEAVSNIARTLAS